VAARVSREPRTVVCMPVTVPQAAIASFSGLLARSSASSNLR
jgi:hypothetical protein